VYAECPNIVCNLCKQVGHKALDCPSIICNLCKQQGHKAVNCPNPRGTLSTPAAGGSKGASKQAAADEQQPLKLRAAVPPLMRQSGSSCGSNASPTSFAAAAASAAGGHLAAAGSSTAQQQQQAQVQEEVPLAPALGQPASAAELQSRQQQHSQLLSQLYKAASEAAVAFLDNNSKLQALYAIQPAYLSRLIQSLPQHTPDAQLSLLESAVQSVLRQQQHGQGQQAWQQQQQPAQAAAGPAPSQQDHSQLLRPAVSSSSGSTPVSPATPKVCVSGDVTDATQGIKPGDLAPQLAKQLVAEFGDMLPNRWQQLPSWRQLEARLSFPDGNYVQRRLQFREKRRQLQLLTLQMRAAAAAARQQQQAAGGWAAGGTGLRPAAGSKPGVRVTHQTQAAPAATAAAPAAARPPNAASTCSYAAALAGMKAAAAAASAAGSAAAAADDVQPAATSGATCSGDCACAAASQASGDGSPAAESIPAAAQSSTDASSSSTATTAGPAQQSEQSCGSSIAVCRRCGMMGHAVQHCAQPRCSRCHLWWHSEAQCASACQFCGSLDHQGDAEQPSSCQSFRCKACKMFGHTASICPHVQLHSLQEKARQVSAQQQMGGSPEQQQQQHHGHPAPGISPVATPTSVAAVPSSLSSSSNSISYQTLALQAPASPLSRFGGTSNGSSTWDSPLRPPDSPGLGQHGVKPKDLLPEHAKALQEEFPNALPPGWQQMASWRMVEERLRVVAVEGAVFSKRRQMWRDRRKHYQVLTAQALAAAARSAADDAAAGAAAAGEEVIAAVAQQGVAAAAAESNDTMASSSIAVEADVSSVESPAVQQQQQQADPAAAQSAAAAPQGPNQQAEAADNGATAPQEVQAPPQQQQQQQPTGPRQLALLQNKEPDTLIPEWQQQRGSLFGLSALPPSSGGLQLDGMTGQPGSAFACDTASFCCSPIPALTPSVLLSPLAQDALAASAGNRPGPVHGGPSGLSTPMVFAGTGSGSVSRHPSGPLQQVPSSQPNPAGMSPMQGSTPMPTPRGAAAAAAAMAAAAAAVSSGAPVSAAMGPYGVMMGPGVGDAGGCYSPVHYAGPAGVPPRVPVSYGMPQQSSPMPQHAAMAAGRGMNMNMAGSPAMYQQMMAAQRQNQLQQQMMLNSPYAPRAAMPAPEVSPAGNQQMMLNMQLQQQQQQHQARMQRQRRLFMAQQAGGRLPGMGGSDDMGDTGELDDKLGVLGVLGLQ
jgi:hypothetical protein